MQYNVTPCVGVRAALPAQNQQWVPQRINTSINLKHCSSAPQRLRLSATLEKQSRKQSTCCSDLLQTSAPFPYSFTPHGEALQDLLTFPNKALSPLTQTQLGILHHGTEWSSSIKVLLWQQSNLVSAKVLRLCWISTCVLLKALKSAKKKKKICSLAHAPFPKTHIFSYLDNNLLLLLDPVPGLATEQETVPMVPYLHSNNKTRHDLLHLQSTRSSDCVRS